MQKRIISAIIMAIILVPITIYGGKVFDVCVSIIALLGLKEFLDVSSKKENTPFIIRLISYLYLIFFLIDKIINRNLILDYKILSLPFILYLIPVILYHDKEKYSITKAFYLIGGTLFISLAMSMIIYTRFLGLKIFAYLFIITIMTDTFAYFTGYFIGKHKMIPSISPNKTWEGTIGGTFMGVFTASLFYNTCINPSLPIYKLVLVTLFLSILGQFGDLIFSSIKRHYGVKDFSNLIPGHGGILDRLDSIIFVMIGFTLVIGILGG